jgi:predicted transcriptional regulator with HTH domain
MEISKEKRDKIKEGILAFLFHSSPRAFFTSEISKEIARDEEFTKQLLVELQKQGMVACVDKNPKGIKYSKRQRWRIGSKIYETYKKLHEKGIEAY